MPYADAIGQTETQRRAGGASHAGEQPFLELKRHHSDGAKHVVGSIAVNAQHASGGQWLAHTRAFYAAECKAERT